MTDDGWRPGAPGFPERRDEMSERDEMLELADALENFAPDTQTAYARTMRAAAAALRSCSRAATPPSRAAITRAIQDVFETPLKPGWEPKLSERCADAVLTIFPSPCFDKNAVVEECAKIADDFAKYEQTVVDRALADAALSETGRKTVILTAGSRQVAAEQIAHDIRSLLPEIISSEEMDAIERDALAITRADGKTP